MIREATMKDLPWIADLAQDKRRIYERFQPTFWHIAPGAVDRHLRYLASILHDPGAFVLVATGPPGGVSGFALVLRRDAPPVYDPGGPTAFVDDFWVSDEAAWDVDGTALLEACAERARERWGASEIVAVCGRDDVAKGTVLAGSGYTVASEWYVRTLPPRQGPPVVGPPRPDPRRP